MRLLTAVSTLMLIAATVAGCAAGAAPGVEDDPIPVDPRPQARDEQVAVYQLHESGLWLEQEEVAVTVAGEPIEELVLDRWLQNNGGWLPPRLDSEVSVRDGIAYVSFSEAIRDISLDAEGLIVKSLVNTMCALEDVDRVQILVSGKQTDTLGGNSFVGEPLTHDDTMVARPGFRPIAVTDPRRGEAFIEGAVLAVDVEGNTIEIEQHFDSGSLEVEPRISLIADVIIHFQDADGEHSEIELSDVEPGTIVGIILQADGLARAVIVTEL